jgi:hypothetical protein
MRRVIFAVASPSSIKITRMPHVTAQCGSSTDALRMMVSPPAIDGLMKVVEH